MDTPPRLHARGEVDTLGLARLAMMDPVVAFAYQEGVVVCWYEAEEHRGERWYAYAAGPGELCVVPEHHERLEELLWYELSDGAWRCVEGSWFADAAAVAYASAHPESFVLAGRASARAALVDARERLELARKTETVLARRLAAWEAPEPMRTLALELAEQSELNEPEFVRLLTQLWESP